ncbi:MAG: AraC family transcriptional regulator, partial [Bacteroidota bacterium]
MLLIPDRLLKEDFVQVIHNSQQLVILKKKVTRTIQNRQSYVEKHVASIVLEGEQIIKTSEGNSIRIKQGEIGFAHKGIYTVTDVLPQKGCFQSVHFFFNDAMLNNLSSNESFSDNYTSPFLHISTPSAVSLFIESLFELSERIHKPTHTFFEIKFREFLEILRCEHTSKSVYQFLSGLQKNIYKDLHSFMNLHYNKPLTIEDYASLTSRSLATFRREFKIKFGKSPRKWITQKRLEQAEALMKKEDYTVSEVASAVGYENTSYFIKAYKAYF